MRQLLRLSTVSAEGLPDARIVLLKGLADGCMQFFTHYTSKKGQDLAAQPPCSCSLFLAQSGASSSRFGPR